MNGKRKNLQLTLLQGMCVGGFCAIILGGIFVLVAPIFILNEYLDMNMLEVLAIGIHFLCAFFGSLVAGLSAYEKKWMAVCGGTGIYFVIMNSIGILFFDGVSGRFLGGLIACVVGALAAIVLLNREKKTVKRKRKAMRSR